MKIKFTVETWIRIRNGTKCWIRIRNKTMRIRNLQVYTTGGVDGYILHVQTWVLQMLNHKWYLLHDVEKS
jgi:hypothetical protein